MVKRKKTEKPTNVKIMNELSIKELGFFQDKKFLWPLTISVFSFLIAILSIVISLNIHSPFDLEVFASGTYIIRVYPEDHNETFLPTFIIPMEFINHGKQAGVITNIFLNVTVDETKAEYEPKYVIDLKAYLEGDPWKINEISERPFHQFGVSGETTLPMDIIFSPNLHKSYVLLEKGEYVLEIFVSTSKNPEPVLSRKLEFKINDKKLETILNDNIVYVRSPEGYEILYEK